MRLTRRALLTSTMASVAAPAVARLARADAPQVTLKLHHHFSAVSAGHEKFLAPWARRVEAESNGRIRIEIFPSMQLGGAPAHLFDQARDGLADIVWAVPGSTPGRFAKSEVFELPFVLSHRALVNSKAIEDFAAANLRDEFRDIHPLCFSCRDPGVLHAARSIEAIDDLKGLRLHVPNRLAGEAVRALGAQGVMVPTPQVPMALTAHAIDGCLDPWDAVPGLRLNELLKNHTAFGESALSTATFVLAMNKTTYERLPRELKAVFDNNSGQAVAAMAGAMWDLEARAVAETARDHSEPTTLLTAEKVVLWRQATEPVIAAWQKQMKDRRLDGGKLVAAVRDLVTKYADEPEPQPPQTAQRPHPTEQKTAAEPPRQPQSQSQPQAQPSQANTEAFTRPKADAPAASTAAPSPSPAASSPAPAPAAKPAPAAATKPKELDIPL
jgi:TRAP-type C4-dicarboxylate transport system substrate-binding protein